MRIIIRKVESSDKYMVMSDDNDSSYITNNIDFVLDEVRDLLEEGEKQTFNTVREYSKC